MLLFETTLVLLFVAVLLLQVSRWLGIPYPGMLALAGVGVGMLPWAPRLEIEPRLALALFIAPALLDAAFDTAPRELRRNWVPLVSLVFFAVILTTAVVALAGRTVGGLPWGPAVALGAIVAPPDAAAASAVLHQFRLPRRTLTILQGESLLNDAVALLIFGAAVFVTVPTGSGFASSSFLLCLAVPGGAVVGWLFGRLYVLLAPLVAGTLGSSILQFIATYGVWIIAEDLHLSPIITVAVYAMTLARCLPARTSARERVHSYSVWAVVVFLLDVLAFLLMGMQARLIVSRLSPGDLGRELAFAGVVLGLVILVRMAWIMIYGTAIRCFRPPGVPVPSMCLGLLASWCGMRGIVTLATALALPNRFPGRDRIVLSAFVVVLGTLIVQGLTIKPLIAWLRIAPDDSLEEEISMARTAMLDSALQTLAVCRGGEADAVRAEYERARTLAQDRAHPQAATGYNRLRMEAIAAQRKVLEKLRVEGRIDDDAYHRLEEELDWAQLGVAPREQLELLDT
jgi:Na+/H+ antiporter